MLCKSCKQEIPDEARFCTLCGAVQDDPVAEPETNCEEEAVVSEASAEVEVVAEPEVPAEVEVIAAPEVPAEVEVAAEPVSSAAVHAPQKPAIHLPTERGLAAMIFLSFLTFGIYPLVVWCKVSGEINIVASRYDGKRTVHYLSALLLTLPTCFLYPFIWGHGLCRRIGKELERRQIHYRFGAGTMWLWHVLYVVCALILAAIIFIVLFTLGVASKLVYILTALACLLVLLVGPFVFIYKTMKAMNLLNAHFNQYG